MHLWTQGSGISCYSESGGNTNILLLQEIRRNTIRTWILFKAYNIAYTLALSYTESVFKENSMMLSLTEHT